MISRREIQDQHELAVIKDFVNWYNSETSSKYKIVERPNPPDAILKWGDKYLWVEHSRIYRTDDEAREELSHVTPGEKPYRHKEHPIFMPDERIKDKVISKMEDKLTKESYAASFDEHGKGILILAERDALFTEQTLELILEKVGGREIKGDCGYFKEVYLGYRCEHGLAFEKLYG